MRKNVTSRKNSKKDIFIKNGRVAVTEVLRWFNNGVVEAVELFDQWARHQKYRLDPEDKLAEKYYQQKRAFRKRTEYLRRKKLIKTKKTERGLLYELTDEGRVELLKRLVRERPSLLDGQVCLVLYDIPVEAGTGRDALRYFLRWVGFEQVQKSVWQTDKDVVVDVLDFIKRAKVQKWVEVYLGRRLD